MSILTSTAIRLASPYNSLSFGRVEVFHMGVWGTICDHSWDLQDANVVCRQLGYDGALSAPRYAAFGQGNGPIWLDYVQCVGDEIVISDCYHTGWEFLNCRHNREAGVVCRPKGKAIRVQSKFVRSDAIYSKSTLRSV